MGLFDWIGNVIGNAGGVLAMQAGSEVLIDRHTRFITTLVDADWRRYANDHIKQRFINCQDIRNEYDAALLKLAIYWTLAGKHGDQLLQTHLVHAINELRDASTGKISPSISLEVMAHTGTGLDFSEPKSDEIEDEIAYLDYMMTRTTDDEIYEIDFDDYETQYDDTLHDQRKQIERDLDRADLEHQLNLESANRAWIHLQRKFLSDPMNAALASNELLFAAWEQGMQIFANEAAAKGYQVTDWNLMIGGRQKLIEAGMMPMAPYPQAAQPAPVATTTQTSSCPPPLPRPPQHSPKD